MIEVNNNMLDCKLIEQHIQDIKKAYMSTIDWLVVYETNKEFLEAKVAEQNAEVEKIDKKKDPDGKREALGIYSQIKASLDGHIEKKESYDFNLNILEEEVRYYEDLLNTI